MGITKIYSNKTYRIAGALFILLFACYAYFAQNAGNWNTVPRVALTLAMIEDQSLSIDQFRRVTGDIAYYKGKYYTDKAPGMSFMAYPSAAGVVFALKTLSPHIDWVRFRDGKIVWIDSNHMITEPFIILSQVVTIATSGLLTVFAALAIYFVAIKLGAGFGGAVFGSLAYGMATPAWGWSTAFFGHASAGGCLFLGLAAVFFLLQSPHERRRDIWLSFASGALLAWAVVIELTTAPPAFVIALYGLYNMRAWDRRRLLKVFIGALAGGLIFISPLLIYNYAILGKPFGSLYSYTVNFPNMTKGFYGLVYPDFGVFMKLLFSGKHGILWFSPLLVAVPLALIALWRRPGQRSLAVILTVIPIYYFLWNSSFLNWTGGASTTPRYLTPMLPFLCLPLSLLWAGSGKILRAVLLALLAVSMLISLMSVSVSMLHGQSASGNIVTTYLVPEFFHGRIPWFSLPVILIFSNPVVKGYNGQLALIPLYFIIAACVLYIFGELRKNDQAS